MRPREATLSLLNQSVPGGLIDYFDVFALELTVSVVVVSVRVRVTVCVRVTYFLAEAVLAVWVEVRGRLGLYATRVCSICVEKRSILRLSSSGSLGLFPCMSVYVYVYVYVCMCVRVYVRMRVFVYVCMRMCMCICACIVCACVCV